ncbi:MAG TPA: phospholipase D-like domain-containing protein [Stellaceae bacterium]|nr:phospholipase D-like domain-containing protein [Stellaceae bacterium]
MRPLAATVVLAVAPPSITAAVPRAAISVCFAPEEDCAAFAVAAIDRARRQILVNAYNLTTGAGIVEALVRARARGVDVELIATSARHANATPASMPWRQPERRSGSTAPCRSPMPRRWSSTATRH